MMQAMFETISGLGVEASFFRGSQSLSIVMGAMEADEHPHAKAFAKHVAQKRGEAGARPSMHACIAFWRPPASAWCLITFAPFLCVSASKCQSNRPLAIQHTNADTHTHTHTHTHTGFAAFPSLP